MCGPPQGDLAKQAGYWRIGVKAHNRQNLQLALPKLRRMDFEDCFVNIWSPVSLRKHTRDLSHSSSVSVRMRSFSLRRASIRRVALSEARRVPQDPLWIFRCPHAAKESAARRSIPAWSPSWSWFELHLSFPDLQFGFFKRMEGMVHGSSGVTATRFALVRNRDSPPAFNLHVKLQGSEADTSSAAMDVFVVSRPFTAIVTEKTSPGSLGGLERGARSAWLRIIQGLF